MRLIRFAPAVWLLLLAGSSLGLAQEQYQQQQSQAQQEPQQAERRVEPEEDQVEPGYVSRQDFFSVHVPCEFRIEEFTWDSEYGNKVPARRYHCTRGPESYEATVVNYSDIERLHKSRTDTTEADIPDFYWRIDVHASIDYAAAKLRQQAHKITFDAWHYIDLIPGHQLQWINADGSRTFSSIYLHEYRLYVFKATVPADAPPPGMFQQTVSILDADGQRIRYRSIYRHPW